jgi:hypothetical protein
MKIERDYYFKLEFSHYEMCEISKAIECFVKNTDFHHSTTNLEGINLLKGISKNIIESIEGYD